MYFLLWRSSHWLRNELINSVCLVSCIVFKLKGMTINFPSLKAVQGDCIKIQYVQVQLRSCSVLVTINTSLFSHPIFITAPTSRKFTSEKQILLNVCRKREERWAELCSSFFVCPSLGICSSLTEHTTLQQSPPRTSHLSGGTCPPGPGTQRSSPGEEQVRGQLARSEPSLISPHEMFGRQCRARLLNNKFPFYCAD